MSQKFSDSRNLYIKDLVVESSHDDASSPELQDLNMKILGEPTFSLTLARKSRASWRQKENMGIPIPALEFLVIISSNDVDLGHIQIDLNGWSPPPPPSRGSDEIVLENAPKWHFQSAENASRLSLSFDVHNLVPEEMVNRLRADRGNADASELYIYVQFFVPDPSTKADMLNLCGDQFRDKFKTTREEGDIRAAIKIYEQALAFIPPDDPRNVTFTEDLGLGYYTCYDFFGWNPDADKAIAKLQEAIIMAPDDHEDIQRFLSNLAEAFIRRFEWTGLVEDITESIKFLLHAIRNTPDGYKHLPTLLNKLGTAFLRRFERTGDQADIAESIEVQQRALLLTPEGNSNLPSFLNNLGNSLIRRFEQTGDLTDISSSIEYQQRAVQLSSNDHPDLAGLLNNLGGAYICRFEHIGDLADVTESIKLRQRAVELTPEGHSDLPLRLNNLGNSFIRRFERTGELEDISESIRLQQQAVQLTPENHANLPVFLNSLGTSFLHRYERTGEPTDISESIQLRQRAVQLTPEGHADLPAWLNNLGTSFLSRFERTGELADIDESIQLQQRAVELSSVGHADLPARLTNLGTSFILRFGQTHDLADISESIRLQRQAVELVPDGHALLRILLNNLAISFVHRFERTESLDDLSESIRLWRKAIQLTLDDHVDLPALLNNLGTALLHHFDKTRDLADISESIEIRQRAVELTPEGHADLPGWLNNLGVSFLRRFEQTHEKEAFVSALSSFRSSAISSSGPPSVSMIAAQNWASLSKSASPFSPTELLEAHERIIVLLSLITGFENTLKRRHDLLIQSSQLSTAAAAAAMSVNRPGKALEMLEQGRCIVWNQINQLRTPVDDLRVYDSTLADRFSYLSKQLESAGSRTDPRQAGVVLSMDAKVSLQSQAHRHLRLTRERDELLVAIRNIPGFENFLQPRHCTDLMEKLPEDGFVIIINAHKDRCDALILVAGHEEPMHIPLNKFSYEKAATLAEELRRYLTSLRLRSRYSAEEAGFNLRAIRPSKLGSRDSIRNLLKTLWIDLVQPILQALTVEASADERALKRVWWCPTGPFAFLPIHAAGIYKEGEAALLGDCLADFAISSYIPTLSILERLSSRTNTSSKVNGVLLVSQPDAPGLPKILGTVTEVQRTREHLTKLGIRSALYESKDATTDVILKSLSDYSCIHLACHASQGIKDPLESAIHLYDGPLRLSEIIKKDLPDAAFAFLSACQTSTGDEKLPEEAVHLAAGMLAAGYRSVVATMWSISDKHAPNVAETFYKFLFSEDDSGLYEGDRELDIRWSARALHTATRHLRDRVGDSAEGILAWIPYIHFGI